MVFSLQIMQRYRGTHAQVNAAFLFKVDKTNNYKVLETPTLVYGGISSNFVSILSRLFIFNLDIIYLNFYYLGTCYQNRAIFNWKQSARQWCIAKGL